MACHGLCGTANGIKDESTEPFYIPGLFVSRTKERWAAGLGLYIPYAGGGSSYQNFQGTPFDLETFAGWFCFTLSAAYKISERLAGGVDMSLYVGMLDMKSFDPSTGAVMESNYDSFSGYWRYIGLMYKLTKELSIGLVARSPVPIEMDGKLKVSGTELDSEARFTIPATFTLGLGYQPQRNLAIGIFGWYRLYGTMDDLTFETAGVKNEMKTFFHDGWVVGLGAEYQVSTRSTLRAGMKYDQSATEKEGLNPTFCDVDFVIPNFGMAYNVIDTID